MAKEKILIVEDEEDIRELIRYNLSKVGYSIREVSSGEDALSEVKMHPPDLVILDLMLPGVEGLDVCRSIKGNTQTENISVIMLTARSEETDVVIGLEMGADDYITKPFSPRILLARVKAALRRKQKEPVSNQAIIQIHDLKIDPGQHEVKVNDSLVELTFTEFQILHFLALRPGWVFTRNQILDAVRGEDYIATDRSVDVQIAGLRKKLGNIGKCIETVRGIGYRLKK